jgi:hypothetical protein
MTDFRSVLFKGQVTKVDCQTKDLSNYRRTNYER